MSALVPDLYTKLADTLVQHSCSLSKGDKVWIQASECDPLFVEHLINTVSAVGAIPFLRWDDARLAASVLTHGNDEQLRILAKNDADLMAQMDAWIGIRGGNNMFERSAVPADRIQAYSELYLKPVHFDIRVPKTRWVILRWPTPGMAQQAKMATGAFEKFFFDACTVDYAQMARQLEPLRELMVSTDRVHIKGPGETDLRFSIKNIPAIPCAGERNIPDGECFTAPVRDSVEGVIAYNTPTVYEGGDFRNLRLVFKKGHIESFSAASGDADKLAAIFDRDEGARYVGEFSLGTNPKVFEAMQDILFDEKIAGSMHFTPGQAYDEADNGNRSNIHWDLVLIQRPEFGGGEIWFDDQLIRKDGRFVLPQLEALNP